MRQRSLVPVFGFLDENKHYVLTPIDSDSPFKNISFTKYTNGEILVEIEARNKSTIDAIKSKAVPLSYRTFSYVNEVLTIRSTNEEILGPFILALIEQDRSLKPDQASICKCIGIAKQDNYATPSKWLKESPGWVKRAPTTVTGALIDEIDFYCTQNDNDITKVSFQRSNDGEICIDVYSQNQEKLDSIKNTMPGKLSVAEVNGLFRIRLNYCQDADTINLFLNQIEAKEPSLQQPFEEIRRLLPEWLKPDERTPGASNSNMMGISRYIQQALSDFSVITTEPGEHSLVTIMNHFKQFNDEMAVAVCQTLIDSLADSSDQKERLQTIERNILSHFRINPLVASMLKNALLQSNQSTECAPPLYQLAELALSGNPKPFEAGWEFCVKMCAYNVRSIFNQPPGAVLFKTALKANNRQMMDFLLARQALAAASQKEMADLLREAILADNHEVAVLLVKHKANLRKVLCDLASTDFTLNPCFEKLLQAYLNQQDDFEGADNNFHVELMCSAFKRPNSEPLVRTLIRLGVQINAQNQQGETALLMALRGGESDKAALLIQLGARVTHASFNGMTPLCLAIEKCDLATVQLIVDKGASIKLANGETDLTPLQVAINAGKADVVAYLIPLLTQAGLKVDSVLVLVAAAKSNHTAIISMVVAAATDVNTENGQAAFEIVCNNQNIEAIREFIAQGASAKKVHLDLSLLSQHYTQATISPILRYLVDEGMEVNQSHNGISLLSQAIQLGWTDEALFLLSKGADPFELYKPNNALSTAIQCKNQAVVAAIMRQIENAPAGIPNGIIKQAISDQSILFLLFTYCANSHDCFTNDKELAPHYLDFNNQIGQILKTYQLRSDRTLFFSQYPKDIHQMLVDNWLIPADWSRTFVNRLFNTPINATEIDFMAEGISLNEIENIRVALNTQEGQINEPDSNISSSSIRPH